MWNPLSCGLCIWSTGFFGSSSRNREKSALRDVSKGHQFGRTIARQIEARMGELAQWFKKSSENPDSKMLCTPHFGKIVSVELHHFSDASIHRYVQCHCERWIVIHIVIVKDESVQWRLVAVQNDDDGLVQKVTIQMGDAKLGKRAERRKKKKTF